MRHFSALKAQTHPDLVSLFEKLDCALSLGIKVMLVDTAGELYLLDLHGLLLFLLLLFSLVLLIAELAVIHGTAYRRLRLRSDADQVYSAVVSIILRLAEAFDTELIAVFVKKTDFLRVDIVVDKKLFCAYSKAPLFCQRF